MFYKNIPRGLSVRVTGNFQLSILSNVANKINAYAEQILISSFPGTTDESVFGPPAAEDKVRGLTVKCIKKVSKQIGSDRRRANTRNVCGRKSLRWSIDLNFYKPNYPQSFFFPCICWNERASKTKLFCQKPTHFPKFSAAVCFVDSRLKPDTTNLRWSSLVYNRISHGTKLGA